MNVKYVIGGLVLVAIGLSSVHFSLSTAGRSSEVYPVDVYPKQLSPECESGTAQVYDECSDQLTILNDAIKAAGEVDKSVLVMYGAEWCIWCHVFDKYVKGEHSKFTYEWVYQEKEQYWRMAEKENNLRAEQALSLNKYVSENFVVVHIEGEKSNGAEVLVNVGVPGRELAYMPSIVVLDKKGVYLSHLPTSSELTSLEIRKDSGAEFRGYNRPVLQRELEKMREAALKS